MLGFQFVGKGVELVREGGRELALKAGDVVLWDGMQPTEVEIVRVVLQAHAAVPARAGVGGLPAAGRRSARCRRWTGSGPARLLVRYMNALALELPQLEPAAGVAAANAALELLRAAVEPSLPTEPRRRPAPRCGPRSAATCAPTCRTRRSGPASIARAYAMSVRALHALFEDVDASVAGLVRRERLGRCLEDLQRPNGGSVTDIAFRWGFCDAAHFSRVFKREYGATPSEVRQAAAVAATRGR